MRRALVSLFAIMVLHAAVALPVVAQDAAAPPIDAVRFETACRSHVDMQAMVSGLPPSNPPAIDRLCSCVAGSLIGLTQPDVDILTGDLLGVTSEEQRIAYPNYAAVNDKARAGVNFCLTSMGAAVAPPAQPVAPTPAPPPSPAGQAATPPSAAPSPDVPPPPRRMSQAAVGFLNACVDSASFRDYLAGIKPADANLQGTICSCMTGDLRNKVADADLVVIEGDFAPGSAPPRDPARDYAPLAETARASLRACMAESGIKANF